MPPKKRRSSSPSSSSPPKTRRAPTKKPKTSKTSKTGTDTKTTTYAARLATPHDTTIQSFRCTSYLGETIPERCTSCIGKQAIQGGCRFAGLRAFAPGGWVEYGFRSNTEVKVKAKDKALEGKKKKKVEVKLVRRGTRSRPVKEEEELEAQGDGAGEYVGEVRKVDYKVGKEEIVGLRGYVLPLIAETFAGQLRRELRHEEAHLGESSASSSSIDSIPGTPRPLIRILASPEARSLCDACSTSIYMGGYLCGCCGLELCLGCWEEWEPSAARDRGFFGPRDGCSKGRRHVRATMVFVTRATPGQLSGLLGRVEARIPSTDQKEQEAAEAAAAAAEIPTVTAEWPGDGDEGPTYLPVPTTHHSLLPQQQFQALWRRGGVPLVLSGFLERFRLGWDPAYFTARHGRQSCFIHDCLDGAAMQTTVAAFFARFSDPSCADSHKLKDWPPSADFASTFPALFADFESALPFPLYTARSGALNLAAHFPIGYNAPDLGPKMYNAYPSPDFLPRSPPLGVSGTTNLHLDLTDAMNIMLHSSGGEKAPAESTAPKGIPDDAGAIWDIFPPSASAQIREYLNSESYLSAYSSAYKQDDPIHRQLYYLTEDDLLILSQQGVHSHRIFQRPGDAVFVPAGCAHQVRNRRSCVKVAVDWLAPENVRVCQGLVEEARGMMGKTRGGKEDVLQLWTCLGFAWGVFDAEVQEEGGDGGAGGNAGGQEEGRMIVVEVERGRPEGDEVMAGSVEDTNEVVQ